jgi:hypothetical protein
MGAARAKGLGAGGSVANPYGGRYKKEDNNKKDAEPPVLPVKNRPFNAYDARHIAGLRTARLGNNYRERLGVDDLERATKARRVDTEERDLERLGGFRRSWRRGGGGVAGMGAVKARAYAGNRGRDTYEGRPGVFGWMRGRLFGA